MDPTITAAWITGGVGAIGVAGTAITAWIGSRNTRAATERTVEAGAATNRATLAAAREERFWERRAAVYEETLAWLLHGELVSSVELGAFEPSETFEERIKELLGGYEPPGTFETRARMAAYASDEALVAFEAVTWAHFEVRTRRTRVGMVRQNTREAQPSGQGQSAPVVDVGKLTQTRLDDAVDEARAAEKALRQIIRDELRSMPEAATPPAEVPAVRRRFWHRHKAVDD